MQERRVIFFTILEGEIVRGVITVFSRYDLTVSLMTVSLKGGVPVVLLRLVVLDVRDKAGRCYLKPKKK